MNALQTKSPAACIARLTVLLCTCVIGCFASRASAQTPLDETGAAYLGQFPLGLYPGGNRMPAAHRSAGIARAQQVVPRDVSGASNAAGEVVLLGIGGTDAADMFCTSSDANPPSRSGAHLACSGPSMLGRISHNGYGLIEFIDTTTLTIANGAYPGQVAANWEHDNTFFPTVPANAGIPDVTGNYTRIRDNVLARFPTALTEAQVQVAWVKVWNPDPTTSLPSASADAYALLTSLGNVMRLMKTRYPNLQLVFLTSREYGGYATDTTNPEPYAYETGFAVKWLIQAQIDQMANGGTVVDARAGDLNYTTNAAPWLAWGPYLWGNGPAGRLNGPNWVAQDFDATAPSFGTLLSLQGKGKASLELLHFFEISPFTRCWFMALGVCR